MKVLDVLEMSKGRKKGQRRIDLFRRENLETWILIFPPGDVQKMHNHPSDRTYYVLTGKGIVRVDGCVGSNTAFVGKSAVLLKGGHKLIGSCCAGVSGRPAGRRAALFSAAAG